MFHVKRFLRTHVRDNPTQGPCKGSRLGRPGDQKNQSFGARTPAWPHRTSHVPRGTLNPFGRRLYRNSRPTRLDPLGSLLAQWIMFHVKRLLRTHVRNNLIQGPCRGNRPGRPGGQKTTPSNLGGKNAGLGTSHVSRGTPRPFLTRFFRNARTSHLDRPEAIWAIGTCST